MVKWMDSINRFLRLSFDWLVRAFTRLKPYWRIGAALLVLILIVLLIWAAYLRWIDGRGWADWTGLAQYTGTVNKDNRGKTLWDWLGLLIIPIVLAVGALFFNRQERQNEIRIAEERRKSDLEIADNRNQETVLQNYLDKMSELILEKQLMEVKRIQDEVSENENSLPVDEEGTKKLNLVLSDAQRAVRDMAQIRTITILRQLNSTRRNIVLQFLRDADLSSFILRSASLQGADLQGASFSGINLSGADLDGATLSKADLTFVDLSFANLRGADLRGDALIGTNLSGAIACGANLSLAVLGVAKLGRANLINADLRGADLRGADLEGATLSKANLSGANLEGADLRWADLEGADLSGAAITKEQLHSAKSYESATLPDGRTAPSPGKT